MEQLRICPTARWTTQLGSSEDVGDADYQHRRPDPSSRPWATFRAHAALLSIAVESGSSNPGDYQDYSHGTPKALQTNAHSVARARAAATLPPMSSVTSLFHGIMSAGLAGLIWPVRRVSRWLVRSSWTPANRWPNTLRVTAGAGWP